MRIKNLPVEERKKFYRKALRLSESGYNIAEVARELDLAYMTVHNWIEKDIEPKDKCRNLKRVSIESTWEWGYFFGFVLGDGYIFANKGKGTYYIQVSSTKPTTVKMFVKSGRNLGLSPSITQPYFRVKKSPQGDIRTVVRYEARTHSRDVYNSVSKYKQPNHKWEVPDFLNTDKGKLGFIAGMIDAEGTMQWKQGLDYKLRLGSKHKSNLLDFNSLIKELGFSGGSIRHGENVYRLNIYGKENIRRIIEESSPRMEKFNLNERDPHISESSRTLPEEEGERRMELYRGGLNDMEIAEKLGISDTTVCSWRKTRGLKPNYIKNKPKG